MYNKSESGSKSNIRYKFFGDIDDIVDEKGSMYIALRKTAWYNADDGKEPTEDNAKLELRKWQVAGESTPDRPDKGVRFLTDDGPHTLATVLVKNGFGKTKDLLLNLKKRDDFKDSVEHMYTDDEINSDEFFDARNDLLLE